MMNDSLREQIDRQMCGTGYMFKGMKADGTPDCVSFGAVWGGDSAPEEKPTPTPPEGASEIEDEITKEAKRRTSRNNTRVNANGVVQQGTAMGNG
tara:strand:- start:36 stop:320 length:285 start_codon:yes stop_codon:yes gene_type:complete